MGKTTPEPKPKAASPLPPTTRKRVVEQQPDQTDQRKALMGMVEAPDEEQEKKEGTKIDE
jgi:hypothetical protein